MKKVIVLFVFLFSSHLSFSQVHWLINQDEVTDCNMITKGKFINKINEAESIEGYYLKIENGFVIEFVENGKYFIKSKIEFTSNCSYTSTVIENTIPNYNISVGTKIYTEILETASSDKLIKIRSKMDSDWQIFVLQKIED